MLPARPEAVASARTVTWTGKVAIVIGTKSSADRALSAASFEPAAWRWHAPAAVPEPASRFADPIPVWIGDRLLAWVRWNTSPSSQNSYVAEGESGTDLLSLDVDSSVWTKVEPEPALPGVAAAYWTGTGILLFWAPDYGSGRLPPSAPGDPQLRALLLSERELPCSKQATLAAVDPDGGQFTPCGFPFADTSRAIAHEGAGWRVAGGYVAGRGAGTYATCKRMWPPSPWREPPRWYQPSGPP